MPGSLHAQGGRAGCESSCCGQRMGAPVGQQVASLGRPHKVAKVRQHKLRVRARARHQRIARLDVAVERAQAGVHAAHGSRQQARIGRSRQRAGRPLPARCTQAGQPCEGPRVLARGAKAAALAGGASGGAPVAEGPAAGCPQSRLPAGCPQSRLPAGPAPPAGSTLRGCLEQEATLPASRGPCSPQCPAAAPRGPRAPPGTAPRSLGPVAAQHPSCRRPSERRSTPPAGGPTLPQHAVCQLRQGVHCARAA